MRGCRARDPPTLRRVAMKLLWKRYACLAGLLAAALAAHAQDAPGRAGPGTLAAAPGHGMALAAGRVGDARTTQRVLFWNNATIKAVQFDYVPPAAGDNRVYLEQPGPTYSSRAMAIVQVAVFDAIN